MENKIKIIIVDDHPLIREGLKQILSLNTDMEVLAEGSDGTDALSLVEKYDLDILLIDINMPTMSGIEAIAKIRKDNQNLKILLLTVENDFQTLKEAIDLQVNGYILKESAGSSLVDAIRHVYKGGSFIDQSLTKYIFNIIQGNSKLNKPQVSEVENDLLYMLSKRELEILGHIANGLSNKEIAAKLYLSDKTIRNSITQIFKKIKVKDRVQAAIFALNNNIK